MTMLFHGQSIHGTRVRVGQEWEHAWVGGRCRRWVQLDDLQPEAWRKGTGDHGPLQRRFQVYP